MKLKKSEVERLIGGTWSAETALESGEMMDVTTVLTGTFGLRVSRAVYEDCRGSGVVIAGLAALAYADGPGRAPRTVRILAEACGRRGVRAVEVVLVARRKSAWIEVREEGEG